MNVTLNFVVCGNTETVGNCGELCDEAAAAWTKEASRLLDSAAFSGDVRCDSFFQNWHGGRFAEQAPMYGYERFGAVCCTGATIEDDGDERSASWSELPAAVREDLEAKIWAALKTADEAAAAVQADHEKDMADE